jgi:hypothetical protein
MVKYNSNPAPIRAAYLVANGAKYSTDKHKFQTAPSGPNIGSPTGRNIQRDKQKFQTGPNGAEYW